MVSCLIHKYLSSGALVRGLFQSSEEGTPQSGLLNPLLSNIVLHELDKELERRGHPYVKYEDDTLIFCKIKRAANRVRKSISRFLEEELCRVTRITVCEQAH